MTCKNHDTRYRRLRGVAENTIGVLVTALGLTAVLDLPMSIGGISIFPHQYLGAFWGLMSCLTFLTFPVSKKVGGPRGYDLALAALSLILGVFVAVWYPEIMMTIGLLTPMRTVLGVLAIFVVLESTRRVAGLPLVVICGVFILYGHFGALFPGTLATSGLAWDRLINLLFLGADFLFGTPLRIAVLVVFAFILFGQVLFATGAGDVFLDMAQGIMGRHRGGPAKAAVVASGLFGSISGSAVANVVSTGVITIPLMKRTGYRPEFAAAVEAVASTGGAIMPPVMGAAAFVMTEFLGTSYSAVVLAALVPALAYYSALLLMIDLRAVNSGLKGMPREEIPRIAPVLRHGWIYLIPIIVLVASIFFYNIDVSKAALYACASNLVLGLLRPKGREAVRLHRLVQLCAGVARAMVQITAVCAAAGLVVGLVAYTGLGVALAQALVDVAGHSLLLLALGTAAASAILGMGMPATACYILVAVLMAPTLVTAGVQPLLAHLFVFYFGNLSFLTPPVALAVYAAAAIAEAPFIPSCWQAIRLALAGYIVPFIFLYKPGMALMGSPAEIAWSLFDTAVAVVLLAVSLEGRWFRRLPWWVCGVLFGAALLMFVPGWHSRVAGLAIAVPLLFLQYWKALGERRQQPERVPAA